MKTPVLETERLTLRTIREEDLQEIFSCWMSDPDVSRYMMWTAGDMNVTKEFVAFELGNIEKDDWYRWIITKKDGTIIGACLLYFDEEFAAWDISYNLGKKYWGNGYITEAMKEVIRFAVETLKVREIIAFHAAENPASGRVIEKLGFQYEKEIPFECNIGNTTAKFYRLKDSLKLMPVKKEDLDTVWKMQVEAFSGLLAKYQDYDMSPASEKIDKIEARFNQPWTTYYFIVAENKNVGVIRVVDKKDGSRKRISPIWIMEEFRGKGYAQRAIMEAEKIYGPDNWCLDTILQEKGNCHLYEKMGYHQTGKVEHINDRMDIVFYEKD